MVTRKNQKSIGTAMPGLARIAMRSAVSGTYNSSGCLQLHARKAISHKMTGNSIPPLLTDGGLARCNKQKADVLAKVFSSKIVVQYDKLPDLVKECWRVNSTTATGPAMIPASVVCELD